MGAHEQTGVAACFSVDEYEQDVIKKHERTRRDKEDDRTRHIVELRAQTGVVFLTYRASAKVDAEAARVTAGAPLYDFTTADGVQHTVWRAAAAETRAAVDAFARIPALYIADGHHRAASAARARAALQTQVGGGIAEAETFIAVAFPAQPDADPALQPNGQGSGRPIGGRVPRGAAGAVQRDRRPRDAAPQGRGVDVPRWPLVCRRSVARHPRRRLSRERPRRGAAAAARARADARHRRHPDRQAHRLRRRRPRHRRPRARRRLGRGRGRVLDVSGDDRRSDGDFGCRRDHAAQVHLVRAEAEGWVAGPSD